MYTLAYKKPEISNSIALFHFNNANIVDECGNTWTSNGDKQMQFNETGGKFGGCVYGSYENMTGGLYQGYTGPDSTIGDGDFTIEFFYKYDTNAVPGGGSSTGVVNINSNRFCIEGAIIGGLAIPNAIALGATGRTVPNEWWHTAYVGKGDTVSVYYNGTKIHSTKIKNRSLTGSIKILKWESQCLDGYYIDDLRISNIARYDGDFTVPTHELTK